VRILSKTAPEEPIPFLQQKLNMLNKNEYCRRFHQLQWFFVVKFDDTFFIIAAGF